MESLASVAADGGVVGIYAIGGVAGVGKTTFAVHAAPRLAGSFPEIFLRKGARCPFRGLAIGAGPWCPGLPAGITVAAR